MVILFRLYEKGGSRNGNKKNKVIEKAQEELQYLTGDAAIKRKAELREKWIMAYKGSMEYAKQEGLRQGREEGMKQGIEEGKKEGKKEGIKQGIEKKQTEVIREMLKLGMDKQTICKITKAEAKEIENIEKYVRN